MMLARIDDLNKIESLGITHIYTGKDEGCHFFMFDVSLTWNVATAQIVPSSVKDNSTLFRKYDLEFSNLVELSMNKYLLKYMIVHNYQVVQRVPHPDRL